MFKQTDKHTSIASKEGKKSLNPLMLKELRGKLLSGYILHVPLAITLKLEIFRRTFEEELFVVI